MNYIKTFQFFLDFIAWVPYDYLFFRDQMYKNQKVMLLRVFRLLWLPKIL